MRGEPVLTDTAPVRYPARTMLFIASVALLTVAALLIAVPGVGAAAPPAGWRYTMVAFSNASDRAMDVYESSDGTTYHLLKKDAFTPPAGSVRDPSIFRHSDGWYYVTYTTADGANIGFARSKDRISWTFLQNHPVPLCCFLLPGTGDGTGSLGSAGSVDIPSLSPFTTKAWAPDWFVDGGRVHVILSMSTGGGFVPYLMTANDSSLRSWSAPVPILGIGADHIDTTIVKVGSTYHAFTKNETHKFVEHAVSSSLIGPYSFVTPGNWGTFVEGPEVVQLPNGAWRIYLDSYKSGKYLYSDSGDGMRTWTAPSVLPEVSGIVRHAGVMREPA